MAADRRDARLAMRDVISLVAAHGTSTFEFVLIERIVDDRQHAANVVLGLTCLLHGSLARRAAARGEPLDVLLARMLDAVESADR